MVSDIDRRLSTDGETPLGVVDVATSFLRLP
jgi:hypothetical protein